MQGPAHTACNLFGDARLERCKNTLSINKNKGAVVNLTEVLNRRSKAFLTVAGFISLILVWIVDYLTGPDFSSIILYLIPVIFVTWFAGRTAGILISVSSAVVWVLTDVIERYPYPHIIIPLWNLAEKLGIFLIVAYILLKLAEEEEALDFERKQFLSILDTTNDLIYISDPETHEILYANSALRNIFGPDIIGKKCYETLQGMSTPCDFCTNQYIFGDNTGKPYIREYRNKVNQRWYRAIDRAIKWPDGRLVRYETAVDITESRKLETERKNILSMFAHDMKNPVISSAGFLSRLLSGKAGPLTEKQAEYMGMMSDELAKLEKLITNFLEFSRLESKEYKPVPIPFNIEKNIKRLIEAAAIEAEKKDIRIFFEIPDDTPATVIADSVQVDRVIANLLDNAIKYTDPHGTVTVSLLHREQDILVQVRDTGIGIREDQIPHIFDAFYRVTRDSRGSGLGLSIVESIVRLNGGKIWVESTYGKGSSFSFTLPKHPTKL